MEYGLFLITTGSALRAFSIITDFVVGVLGARGFLNRTLRIVVGVCGDVMNLSAPRALGFAGSTRISRWRHARNIFVL